MTVAENITFAMDNMTTFSKKEKEEKVISFLKQVNLPDAADKLPRELSGGMRRRVGIVRAMVINPALALLDEPTAGLDPVTTSIVIDMIHRIGRLIGSTMVCVTSSVDVAFRFAARVAILNEGKIIAVGTHEELLQHHDPWIRNFLTLRGACPQSSTL
jgi:phospholipid/cholesterol/gamma-HCH transport system ATP-binding protein